MSVFVLKNLTGGLQEDSVGAPSNQVKKFQNLRINNAGNTLSQYGRVLDYKTSNLYRVPADSNGVRRINKLIPYKTDQLGTFLLKASGQNSYYKDGTSYVELKYNSAPITNVVCFNGSDVLFVPGAFMNISPVFAPDIKGVAPGLGCFDYNNDTYTTGSGNLSSQAIVILVRSTDVTQTGVTTTNAVSTITVSSAVGIKKGHRITKSNGGIDNDTYVTNISGLTITMSKPAIATTAAGTVSFTSDILLDSNCIQNGVNQTFYFYKIASPGLGLYTSSIGDKAYSRTSDTDTRISFAKYENFLIMADGELKDPPSVFYEEFDGYKKLKTLGLPSPLTEWLEPDVNLSILPNIIFTGGSGGSANGFSWAFVYRHDFVTGGKQYTWRSRPFFFLSSLFSFGVTNAGSEGLTSIDLPHHFLLARGSAKSTSSSNPTQSGGFSSDRGQFSVEIYRTESSGNIFYLYNVANNIITTPGVATNGTIKIANLWSKKNPTLYTTGGVAENYRPPVCKYVAASGPFVYFAHGYEVDVFDRQTQLLRNRIWQSKPGLPYAVPADFYVDVDEPVTGLTTIKTVPIVFTENYVYRIEGSFDSFGRGSVAAKRISEITGCVSNDSIIQTEDGVYFAGTDGFYFTDGFVLKLLSRNISNTYKSIVGSDTRKNLISGGIDIVNREVHWTVQISDTEGEAVEANASFVYDIDNDCIVGPHISGFDDGNPSNGNESVKAILENVALTASSNLATVAITDVSGILEKGQILFSSALPFGTRLADDPVISGSNYDLTLTNGAYVTGSYDLRSLDKDSTTWMFFEQFMPTCYAYFGNELYHGDPRGFTFKYDQKKPYNDVVDAGNTNASTWQINPIKYHLATIDSDLGVAAYKKWVSRATIKLRFSSDIRSNISVQPATEREANGLITNTTVLEDTNNTPWGYSGIPWGSPLLFATASDVKDYEVHMPKDAGLRSTYRAMHLTNADVVIQESGSMATQALVATVSGNIKSLTISSLTNWYGNILGYYVKFFTIDQSGNVQYLFNGKKFWITKRVSDSVVEVLDENGDLVDTSSYDFEVRGMRKDDVIELQEIDYYFTPIGRGQEAGGQPPSGSGA
jgi:hypothetical protein